MNPPSLSSITGAFLSPFPQVVLDKLVGDLVDYVTRGGPSSSKDPNELQQLLQSDLKALRNARQKIKGTLRVAKKLQKQDESVAHFLRELRDVVYAAQDLEDDLEYIELHEKLEKFNKPEASSQSTAKKPRLLSSEHLELSLDDILNSIRNITEQLNCIDLGLKDAINMAMLFKELDNREENNFGGQYQIISQQNVTTSSMIQRKIYGRDNEKAQLIGMMKEPPRIKGDVSVLPILGLGGIGKTTLAQYVFNNQEVEDYFHEKAWMYVSHNYDRNRITREIVDSLSNYKGRKFPHSTNLDCLERELKKKLAGKRFLLVLDDVWSGEWTELLYPLESAATECVKIVVTATDQIVLQGKGKRNEIILKGLEEHDYWSFFVTCAFGDKDLSKYPPRLHDIGKQIVRKLKGSPLAAKTVGQVLRRNLNEEHWMYVLKSNLWELGTDANNIMPVLALSYHHLPEHLQLCFVFCSMFPKGYEFNVNSVVSMWIAHGYVFEAEISLKAAEDIGHEYVTELLSRSFFEFGSSEDSLKMHDLLHDLAQSVSLGECYYIYEGQMLKRIPDSVRHLCVQNSVNLSSICEMKNLRSLVIFKGGLNALELEALKSIRVLVLLDSEVQEISPAISHLKHLRYLDVYETSIKSLPESLCGLYQLRVLKLKKLDRLPNHLSNLINLRFFVVNCQSGLSFSRPWVLVFPVKKETGYKMAQLKGMKELRGTLVIRKIENIQGREDAMEANLKEKCHLKGLHLFWSGSFSSSQVVEEVLESLQPHPNLKNLYIVKYMGSRAPSWSMTYSMQNLEKIVLHSCLNWTHLPPLGQLPFLKSLSLEDMNATIESSDDLNVVFPSLERLELEGASISFNGMSVTREGCWYFPRLRYLSITSCDIVRGLPWTMLAALEELNIYYSHGLDDQLPGCLEGLNSLTKLTIREAKMESLPDTVTNTLKALRILDLSLCNELTLVGLQPLSSLEYLRISGCSKLVYWQSENQEEEALLPKLHHMNIEHCQSVEYLPTWLPSIPSLEILSIVTCPLIRSLPDGGLPSSLRELCILDCDKVLIDRCQEEGSHEWFMIKHIPERKLSAMSL